MDNSPSYRPFVSTLLMHFILYHDILNRYHFSTMDSNPDSELYGNKRQNQRLLFGEQRAETSLRTAGCSPASTSHRNQCIVFLPNEKWEKWFQKVWDCVAGRLEDVEVRRWRLGARWVSRDAPSREALSRVSEPGLWAGSLRLWAGSLNRVSEALNRVSEPGLWGSEPGLWAKTLSRDS